MPIHINRIAGYDFEDIRGRLQPTAEKLEVFIRPGIDFEYVRKTGVRGAPSQIQTLHYVESWASAATALEAYVSLIDGSVYEIIQHTTSYGYFRILDVTELNAQAVANVIGSIVTTPTVLQLCGWTVVSSEPP